MLSASRGKLGSWVATQGAATVAAVVVPTDDGWLMMCSHDWAVDGLSWARFADSPLKHVVARGDLGRGAVVAVVDTNDQGRENPLGVFAVVADRVPTSLVLAVRGVYGVDRGG